MTDMTTLHAPAIDIWARIIANTTITPTCWFWRGAVNSRGYGQIGSGRRGMTALVHRVSVIVRDGGIDDDLTVDHMCGNKRCVRPDHLDVVTRAENTIRRFAVNGYHLGGKCGAGHLLTPENVYHHPRGQLVCRTCARGWRSPEPTSAEIRSWARRNGFEVADKGRLSAEVLTAYYNSNGAAA